MVGERSMRIETTGPLQSLQYSRPVFFSFFFFFFVFFFLFLGMFRKLIDLVVLFDPNECQVFVAIIIKDSCLFCQDTRRKLFRRKFDERAKFYTSSAIWLPCDHFSGLGSPKPVY